MRQRRTLQTDSLDLLLDTICNTFGGILFIAMLVVLLVQSTEVLPTTEAEAGVTPADLQLLEQDLRNLQEELLILQQSRSAQQKLEAQFAPAAARELVEQRNVSQAERDRLAAERNQALADLAQRQAHTRQIEQDLATLDRQVQQAEAERQQAVTSAQQEREARTQQLRLPVVRQTSKTQVGVILRYGRMYVWHRYSRSGDRMGLNTAEFVVVKDRSDGLVTTPIPSAGVPLTDGPECLQALRQRLKSFSPELFAIVPIVYGDSFTEFRYLKNALVKLGFDYELMPMTEGESVMDRGGRSSGVQ